MISITFALLAVFSATSVSGGLLPDTGSGDAPEIIGSGNTASPKFQLHQNIVGSGFMEAFKWEIFDDPTHGRVNYVDQATALRKNMTYASGDKFVMRPDFHSIVPPSARGRDSNRISSYSTYRDSVVVLDVQHVPDSICSVWPAFWTVTASKWPEGGEIDIYEGVNKNEANLGSLHTSQGCTMAQNRPQTGTTTSTDCNARANNNQGCGTQFNKPSSFGSSLNSIGGGWFAMKRTDGGIYMWFWGRNDPTVPKAVAQGSKEATPDASWGTPAASFPASGTCNIHDRFDAHRIVFDTTFCGDYAGSQYGSAGCPGSCPDFVNNNPAAFAGAFWEINALRVYTPGKSSSGIL